MLLQVVFMKGMHKWCAVDLRPERQAGSGFSSLASHSSRSRRVRRADLSRLGSRIPWHSIISHGGDSVLRVAILWIEL